MSPAPSPLTELSLGHSDDCSLMQMSPVSLLVSRRGQVGSVTWGVIFSPHLPLLSSPFPTSPLFAPRPSWAICSPLVQDRSAQRISLSSQLLRSPRLSTIIRPHCPQLSSLCIPLTLLASSR